MVFFFSCSGILKKTLMEGFSGIWKQDKAGTSISGNPGVMWSEMSADACLDLPPCVSSPTPIANYPLPLHTWQVLLLLWEEGIWQEYASSGKTCGARELCISTFPTWTSSVSLISAEIYCLKYIVLLQHRVESAISECELIGWWTVSAQPPASLA